MSTYYPIVQQGLRLLLLIANLIGWCAYHTTSCDAIEQRVTVSVVDADTGEPLAARLYLTADAGTPYYFRSSVEGGSAVTYEKQNWLDAQSIEYHTTISAHQVYAMVPPGRYTLIAERGKCYRVVTQAIEVTDRESDVKISLERWCDPVAKGWYSGDTHLHRTVEDLRNVVMAEDLNVALPLTSWVTRSDSIPANSNKTIPDSQLSTLIEVDSKHVIWPRNTEYEIFTVGKQQHTLGALFVLGHQDNLQLGAPPWQPVMKSLKNTPSTVLYDMDKLDWPFAMVLPTLGENCLYELSNNHVWRTKFAFKDWNSAAPSYLIPPFGSQIGGHRGWLDYTHGMYYSLLNCGLKLPPSAGTANGVHPVPAGFGRVYVHLPDGFSFDAWMKGLKAGHSFVTTGPMLFATANQLDPGHVFRRERGSDEPISLDMEVVSDQPLLYGELIVNGVPQQLLRPQNEPLGKRGVRTQLRQSFVPDRSGWLAVRFWESQPDGQVRFVHSAPWYIELEGQPTRISRQEKEYLVDRMRQEMARSNGVVSAEAMEEYRTALEFYQAVPEEDGHSPRVARSAASQTDLNEWLDNMIVHHRFTASEVREATGLDLAEATEQVRQRALKVMEPITQVRILPYPGGRHPRRGFLDGAIEPQRETKISIFPPWQDGGYVVVDVPEAIFSNLGLTYLAHTHIPTLWDELEKPLQRLEWTKTPVGYTVRRELPNGIEIQSHVKSRVDGVDMRIDLTNKTTARLTGLRVQVCTMLKGLSGFQLQQPAETIIEGPIIAIRGLDNREQPTKRWLVTQWTPNLRVWSNPPVPCIHSDPIFPDCDPGQTVSVSGRLQFYEGDDVQALLK